MLWRRFGDIGAEGSGQIESGLITCRIYAPESHTGLRSLEASAAPLKACSTPASTCTSYRWLNRIFSGRLRANCHQLYELEDANNNCTSHHVTNGSRDQGCPASSGASRWSPPRLFWLREPFRSGEANKGLRKEGLILFDVHSICWWPYYFETLQASHSQRFSTPSFGSPKPLAGSTLCTVGIDNGRTPRREPDS